MTGADAPMPVRRRTAARLACVQALYEMDVAGAESESVLQEFMAARWAHVNEGTALPEPDSAFLIELLRGIAHTRPGLDEAIAEALAPGWTLDRLEVLLRAVLRAGAYELRERPDIPARVVINEYLDVAHAFFDGNEPALVNGVLDRLARRYRPGEGGAAADVRRSPTE